MLSRSNPLPVSSLDILNVFALRVEEGKEKDSGDPDWLPLPLRFWFWVPLVVILVLGAIGLEVALHFSKRNQGELLKV